MQPAGLAEIEAAKQDGRWHAAYLSQRNAAVPPDLEAALAENVKAQEAFNRLDKTGRYAVILPILKATTPEIRAARLQKALTRLAGPGQKT